MQLLSHMQDEAQFAISPSFPYPNATSIYDNNQISDLLEGFNAGNSFESEDHQLPSESPDAGYEGLYSYAVVSEPDPVMLNPAWTLPRRGMGAADQYNALSTAVSPPQTLGVPFDHNGLHPPSISSGASAHSSPPSHPLTPNMEGMDVPNSAPGPALEGLPQLDLTNCSPLSAPAMTYEFSSLDEAVESLAGPTPRNRFVSRSFPYSPPPRSAALREPTPVKAQSHVFEDQYPSSHNIYTRRRSVSLSLQPQQLSLQEVGRPGFARQSSHPPVMHHYTNNLGTVPAQQAPQDRKLQAQKRRVTMQSVIAEARLPSSMTRKPMPPIPSVTVQQALDALNSVEAYLQHTIMSQNPDEPEGFVTTSHWHLIKDLQCRLKQRARDQGLL